MMPENELIETDDGGEVLVQGPMPLTPKEEAFVRAYADPESATYGKATKSAELAKYQEPHTAAWRLRRRPKIIARIAEYEKLTRVVIGRILTDLENERQLALAKGDIASAVRASELQGKHLAMFTDKVAVDDPEARLVYDVREAIEARRISAILLMRQDPLAALADAPPAALPEPKPAEQEQARPRRAMPADFAALEQAPRKAPRTTRQKDE